MAKPEMKIIFLTKAEALFLDDAITVMTDREGMAGVIGMRPVVPSAMLSVPPDLIERIGMAVLLTTASPEIKEAPLEVDDSELYLLRECAQSSVKIQEEPVGFNLKRKIYLALLGENYNDTLQFQKLMEDMEIDSGTAKQRAKENFN